MSALLDGQLPPDEAERAWAHVHGCHACRDQVEREGWVKTSLAGLSYAAGAGAAPAHLKGSLRGGPDALSPGDSYLAMSGSHRRRHTGLVAIGGGAVGVAVVGLLALGAGGSVQTNDREAPATHLVRPSDAPRVLTPTIAPVASPAHGPHAP